MPFEIWYYMYMYVHVQVLKEDKTWLVLVPGLDDTLYNKSKMNRNNTFHIPKRCSCQQFGGRKDSWRKSQGAGSIPDYRLNRSCPTPTPPPFDSWVLSGFPWSWLKKTRQDLKANFNIHRPKRGKRSASGWLVKSQPITWWWRPQYRRSKWSSTSCAGVSVAICSLLLSAHEQRCTVPGTGPYN